MKLSFLICLLVLVALLGCERTKPEDSEILARVGDATITTTDLKSEIKRRKGNRQPTTDSASVLRELVLRAALLEKSRRLGLDQDPDVKRTIENLMIARLKEAELSPVIGAVEVSEEELEEAYVQRSTEFRKDERRRLAILLLKLNPHRPQQLNDQIIERIKTARQTALKEKLPEGFGALAIRTSDDQASRYKGGDIGWITKGRIPARIPEAVIEAGFALDSPGSISEVIQTPAAVAVVKCIEVEQGGISPLKEIEGSLKRELIKQKQATIREEFEIRIQSEVGVERFDSKLPELHLDVDDAESGDGAVVEGIPRLPTK